MNPTPTFTYADAELQGIFAAIKARNEGKLVEQRHPEKQPEWNLMMPADDSILVCDGWLYRPQPTPSTRPWDCPADVPTPICWIRTKGVSQSWLVIGVGTDGVSSLQSHVPWSWLPNGEYSTTRRKDDWHPCTVPNQ